MALLNVYRNRRVAIMLGLGFSSGLPLALTTSTLQAWATVEGVSLQAIGLLTLVGSAYTLKFLWAPLMDRFTINILGRRRGWILLTQLLLCISIFLMGCFSPSKALGCLAALAVITVFLSASQDIVFDAYRSDVLRPAERGAGAASSVLGYRIGLLVSGGLALILADNFLGWQATYQLLGIVVLLCAGFTYLAPEPEVQPSPPRSLQEAIVAPLKDFFSKSGAWSILLLIVLYKLGDAFAGSLSTAFLIRSLNFSATEVGAINKALGLLATVAGALLGGALLPRLGLYRALLWFGLLQAVSNLGFYLLAITPKHLLSMAAAIGFENLCGGLGTAAFVALLMSLCQAQFSATQFALLSALAAVGRTYLAGPLAPPLVEHLGWPHFFILSTLLALPGLLLLIKQKKLLERFMN